MTLAALLTPTNHRDRDGDAGTPRTRTRIVATPNTDGFDDVFIVPRTEPHVEQHAEAGAATVRLTGSMAA